MDNLFGLLVCPNCGGVGLRVEAGALPPGDLVPERGHTTCERCGWRTLIADQILDLTSKTTTVPLTLAGRSNEMPFVPEIYENLWRPRSLSLLTGKAFSPARELELIVEWAQPKAGDWIVDLGTSTGLYARAMARAGAGRAHIIALDHARGMLTFARRTARREGLNHIVYLRAFAETLPFAEASVDVIVCGGSLNEFHSMTQALREMRRVLKAGGRIVTMSLLAATGTTGKWVQRLLGLSGLYFPTRAAFHAHIREADLTVVREQVFGLVIFTLLEPKT